MKKLVIFCMLILTSSISFAQFNLPFQSNIINRHFQGWGGMFNFKERGFEPVFNLNTPNFNKVRVYLSEIPEFEKPFSRRKVNVVTFEIPSDTSLVLLRFYGVEQTIEMLKSVRDVMQKCEENDKISKKDLRKLTKTIKSNIPNSACFWNDFAGFNNKLEPIIVLIENSEPMIVLEGISYCRIKFKDFTTIIDPSFNGDVSIRTIVQLPLNGIDEVTEMINKLNFMSNIPLYRR